MSASTTCVPAFSRGPCPPFDGLAFRLHREEEAFGGVPLDAFSLARLRDVEEEADVGFGAGRRRGGSFTAARCHRGTAPRPVRRRCPLHPLRQRPFSTDF